MFDEVRVGFDPAQNEFLVLGVERDIEGHLVPDSNVYPFEIQSRAVEFAEGVARKRGRKGARVRIMDEIDESGWIVGPLGMVVGRIEADGYPDPTFPVGDVILALSGVPAN